jgi:hypothetical protein
VAHLHIKRIDINGFKLIRGYQISLYVRWKVKVPYTWPTFPVHMIGTWTIPILVQGLKIQLIFSKIIKIWRDRSGPISEKSALFTKKSVLLIKKSVQKSIPNHIMAYHILDSKFQIGCASSARHCASKVTLRLTWLVIWSTTPLWLFQVLGRAEVTWNVILLNTYCVFWY